MKVLALIPARGGSKGIPNKNIKDLKGKPLIAYTVDAARESGLFDDIIVSTDDEKIAEVAKACGASVPFMRPDDLATDQSPTLPVVQHVIATLAQQGKEYDAVCLLQATSPFRTSQDIIRSIETFQAEQTDSLISVREVPHAYNPHWVFEPEGDSNTLRIATGEKEIIPRRQELPKAYIRDGMIYLTKTGVIMEQNSLYGTSIAYYISEAKEHVNLDTLEDWQEAESILENREKN